jgi:hypothetical protein
MKRSPIEEPKRIALEFASVALEEIRDNVRFKHDYSLRTEEALFSAGLDASFFSTASTYLHTRARAL